MVTLLAHEPTDSPSVCPVDPVPLDPPSPLEAALGYAALGWYVVSLCYPLLGGGCSHPANFVRRKPHKPGKAPLTKHGVNDSSIDPDQIRDWWRKWPNANIGIDLAKSGLLAIAPDSAAWLEEFQRRGLGKPLAAAMSGGGEGHMHFYYTRPKDCPIRRINRSGEYDIQTGGYLVARLHCTSPANAMSG